MDPEGSQNTLDGQRQDLLLKPGYTLATVTDKISSIVLTRGTTKGWMVGFGISFALLMMFNVAIAYLFVKGVGIWGINIPIGWAFAITNFVWWIGIGHAGTLISAIPSPDAPEVAHFHQPFRRSDDAFLPWHVRGMFPLLHMGRPWLFFYMMPYPNPMWLWPQFRSPLVWDVFAVSTYFTVSLAVLVRGSDSRSGNPARPRQEVASRRSFTACWRWAGAARQCTGRATNLPRCCWQVLQRRWLFRFTPW